METIQIDVSKFDIYELEKYLGRINIKKLYIGNNLDGNVSFEDFLFVYNTDEKFCNFIDYSFKCLEVNEFEKNILNEILLICKNTKIKLKSKILKTLVLYTKFIDSECYLMPENENWDTVGSRIYVWLSIK
jgi:hypothetical protein